MRSSPQPTVRSLARPSLRTIGAACLLCCAATPAQEPGDLAAEGLELRVDAAVVDAMARFDLDGVVVVAGREGRVELARGWGYLDAAAAVPAVPDAVFRLEEPGELVTVAAVLRLVDEGVLSLDDPLGELLEELAGEDRGITLEHLVAHTSGLPDVEELSGERDGGADAEGGDARPDDGAASARRIAAELADLPLAFDPGTRCEPSGTALALARLAAERAAQRDWRDVAAGALLEPADLVRSELCSRHARAEEAEAASEEAEADERPAPDEEAPAGEDEPERVTLQPYLCTTGEDLLRLQTALLDGELLSAASRQLLVTPVALEDGSAAERSFGYRIGEPDGLAVLTAGGVRETDEQRCQLARYPDHGLDVIVLLRGGTCPAEDVQRRVARALLDLVETDEFEVPLTADLRQAFVGEYQMVSSPVEIMPGEDGGLVLRWMGAETFVLRYRGQATFDVPDELGTKVRFDEARDGAYEVLELHRDGEVSIARRIG